MEEEEITGNFDIDVSINDVKPSVTVDFASSHSLHQAVSCPSNSEEKFNGRSNISLSNSSPSLMLEAPTDSEDKYTDTACMDPQQDVKPDLNQCNEVIRPEKQVYERQPRPNRFSELDSSGFSEPHNLSNCSNISLEQNFAVTLDDSVDTNCENNDASYDLCCPKTSPSNSSEHVVEKGFGDNILTELDEVLCDIPSNSEINVISNTDSHGSNAPHFSENDITHLEETIAGLQNEIEKLKSDLDKSRDDHYIEIQSLERVLSQERHRLQQQEDLSSKTIAQLRNDLEKKQQLLNSTIKDRESIVVKYAVSEKAVITLRRDLETAERKLKEANRSRDLLSERLRIVQADKEKANNILESKGQELSTLNRENQRLKEDLRWTQNKLKSVSESKKDAEHRITDLIRKVEESRLQVEQAHKDAQATIKNFQESQENRAFVLDQQLREQQAQLILERHERADSEGTLKQLNLEVDSLKKKQQALIAENNQLSLKVWLLLNPTGFPWDSAAAKPTSQMSQQVNSGQRLYPPFDAASAKSTCQSSQESIQPEKTNKEKNPAAGFQVQTLEKERLDGDQRLSRLKQDSDSHHQEVAELRERLTEMESLRAQLQHYEDQLATCRSEMERLRQANAELQQDASSCREREAELLEFTQKLTEKNVRLQSEFSALEAKAQMLEAEQSPMMKKLSEAESRVAALSKQLEDEQRERQEESSLLARHLAEKTHRTQQLQQQLEDCQGEIELLKRKHAASVRELTRELQHVHKRQENSENNGSGSSGSGSTSLGQESRASSTSSLNNACEIQQSPSMSSVVFSNGVEIDKQVLIDRLIKLQRDNARKAEKLDFLEEHNQTLLLELQKKSRIIQSYVMRAPAGALSSDTMDQNKAELAKRSGIMASMYGSKTDEAMTLELSMEINRKLQAVLEDTLLKNITLKESIDTLGSEIARLSHKK